MWMRGYGSRGVGTVQIWRQHRSGEKNQIMDKGTVDWVCRVVEHEREMAVPYSYVGFVGLLLCSALCGFFRFQFYQRIVHGTGTRFRFGAMSCSLCIKLDGYGDPKQRRSRPVEYSCDVRTRGLWGDRGGGNGFLHAGVVGTDCDADPFGNLHHGVYIEKQEVRYII